MTCIVGMIDRKRKKVIIGADSAASNGSNLFIRKDKKIFKKGDFIIGCTSSFRMIQLLNFSLKLPEIKDKDIYEYMCTDFVNAIRECFKDGGFLQKTTDGDDKGGTFLVAYKNRLFKIEADFQVAENWNGIDSCGCGQDFALGALYSCLNDASISTEEKINKALQAAEFLSIGVSRPFIIETT